MVSFNYRRKIKKLLNPHQCDNPEKLSEQQRTFYSVCTIKSKSEEDKERDRIQIRNFPGVPGWVESGEQRRFVYITF